MKTKKSKVYTIYWNLQNNLILWRQAILLYIIQLTEHTCPCAVHLFLIHTIVSCVHWSTGKTDPASIFRISWTPCLYFMPAGQCFCAGLSKEVIYLMTLGNITISDGRTKEKQTHYQQKQKLLHSLQEVLCWWGMLPEV